MRSIEEIRTRADELARTREALTSRAERAINRLSAEDYARAAHDVTREMRLLEWVLGEQEYAPV